MKIVFITCVLFFKSLFFEIQINFYHVFDEINTKLTTILCNFISFMFEKQSFFNQ